MLWCTTRGVSRRSYKKQIQHRQPVLPVPPPISAKAPGTLREIQNGSKKASPNAWGDVKPDVKLPSKAFGDSLTRASGGRDRVLTGGGIFGDLKLEGLDAAQMDDLGGVTGEILAA
jgi:hypothetical protein